MPRIVITEPDKEGQPYRFELERELVSMGRRETNDIVLECRSTSSDHCTMERVDGGFILRDQNSTNGIKQGKSLMQIIDLKDGMDISMGDVTLSFQLSEEETKTLSEESFVPQQMKKRPASPPKDEAPKESPQALKESKSKPPAKKLPEPVENAEPSSPPSPSPASYVQPAMHSGGNSIKPLLIFILVPLAIFTGMSLSHKMRTGESLPSKLVDNLMRKPVAEKTNEPNDSQTSSEATSQRSDSQSGEEME